MSEMTPDTLRKIGDAVDALLGDGPVSNTDIHAHASAWGAGIEQLRLAIIDQANTEAELNEAQARIEALEKERRLYRHNITKWSDIIAEKETRIEALEKALYDAKMAGFVEANHIEALEKLVIEWGRDLAVGDVHALDRPLLLEAKRLAALAEEKRP